jgi:hypothetical protein
MTGERITGLGHGGLVTSYRTEPALRSGAELANKNAVVVGQREADPNPKAAILLGKLAEQTNSKNRYNWAVWLDATFPHVGLIAGKRGSGKSYDLGIIAEGLCAPDSQIAFGTQSFAMVLFDTQNQFWTLRKSGDQLPAPELALLKPWSLSPVPLAPPTVFRPRGTAELASFEVEFGIRPTDLEPDDWTALCGLERYTAMGQCLRTAIAAMSGQWAVPNLLDWLGSGGASGSFPQNTVDAVLWRLAAVEDSQLFDPSAEDIAARLGRPGAKSVIELADLDDATKSVVVAVVMRRLMKWAAPAQRRRKLAAISGDDLPSNEDVAPRIWVLIDEAHLVCPAGAETAARPIIVDYVKRGRDAGLSLVLATQQPSALDTGAISQNDLVFIHKLTIDPDISAATARMPARPPTSVTKLPRATELRGVDEIARSLDAGQALLADSESSRAFIMQSRPRVSPHGGGEPTL